jgi:lantibiotic biosynthesis protein
MTWRPILEGDDAERARRAIAEIAGMLAGPVTLRPGLEHSLSGGAAGIATFHAYRGSERSAARWLAAAAGALGRGGLNGSLSAGVTGIAWALGHVGGERTPEVDRWLFEHLSGEPTPDDLAGFAAYALERLPDPVARRCLELLVVRLDELAVLDRGGVIWPDAGDGPAIVRALAACCGAGVAQEHARLLLGYAVYWLLGQRDDLAAAAAVLLAGRWAREPEWVAAGLELARAATPEKTEDPAGIGHVLNRLHQATGDPELLRNARGWLRRALRGAPHTEPGLVGGAAGVGLALLAATTDVEPAWDRVHLLSPPRPPTRSRAPGARAWPPRGGAWTLPPTADRPTPMGRPARLPAA